MDQQADSSPGLIRVWLKKPDFKKEKKKYFQDSEEQEGGPCSSV